MELETIGTTISPDIKENANRFGAMQPTRQCLICEKRENPNVNIVNTSWAWLCPECKSKLKNLLYG